MALNGGALNSHAVNDSSEEILLGAGQLAAIEQVVAKIGSGELAAFEQDIQLRLSSTESEELASFEQIVESVYSGELAAIDQRVRDSTVPDHLTRFGWDLTLVIGGYTIPANQIHGNIEITRTENDAALMRITLIPPIGIQDVESYHGKTVILDALTDDGVTRIYTGTVDIPEIDLIEEKITLLCTDRRTEQINAQLGSVVQGIGVYSDQIFKETKDVAQEVEQRLTTIPASLDFDAYGNYTLTSWYPKAAADFTLEDDDIYRNLPYVELASRGRITNKVNINFQYRYERFYHHTRSFNWESPIYDDICLLLEDGYSLTFKSAILAAINSAGWPIVGEVDFEPIHESGWYWCSGHWVPWSTIQLSGVNEPTLDESGNQVQDSEGNDLYQFKVTGATNYSDLYCNAAYWKASTRWAQSITENYTATVQAPQSISQYGTIEQDLNYGIEAEATTQEWENYNTYVSSPLGLNYYIDQDTNRSEMRTAFNVALLQAKNIILGSHRDTRVTVDTFLWPQVDLKHTVEIDTDEVQAKGKVWKITHTLNIGTGEARTQTTIVLFRAQGSASSSSLTLPSKPSDSVTYNTNVIYLGNHFGKDPTTAAAATWTGMIGNKWIYETSNWYRTGYQESFVVDVPAVQDNMRTEKTLSGGASYNLEIPNDTLIITFDGE